jgi:hypothetical protein
VTAAPSPAAVAARRLQHARPSEVDVGKAVQCAVNSTLRLWSDHVIERLLEAIRSNAPDESGEIVLRILREMR